MTRLAAPAPGEFRRGIVGRYGRDADAPLNGMLGLGALTRTLQEFGIGLDALCEGTGVSPESLSDAEARMSQWQKIALFANVKRLSPDPGVGLRAGQRQRMSDFAVFGYAMASSATFADAVRFGIEHVRLAGPVLEKSFRVEGDEAIFEGHDATDLGALLPPITEFWFSSTQALMSLVLERPFPSHRLLLPYAAPPYAALYEPVLGCPVSFDTGVMQWHFDAALLAEPLPNANPIAAKVCAEFCGRMLESFDGESPLVKTIRQACLNSAGGFPGVDAMAARLHLSPRTLHRRLAEAGTGYQDILDELRRRLAVEFLERTGLSIDQIAQRSGFSDVSNFRKAFKKWTGHSPAHFRGRKHQPAGAA